MIDVERRPIAWCAIHDVKVQQEILKPGVGACPECAALSGGQNGEDLIGGERRVRDSGRLGRVHGTAGAGSSRGRRDPVLHETAILNDERGVGTDRAAGEGGGVLMTPEIVRT